MAAERKNAEDASGPSSVIDLTQDDEDLPMDTSAPAFYEGMVDENGAGPSRHKRTKDRKAQEELPATPKPRSRRDRGETEAETKNGTSQDDSYQPESFRPLSRSILPTGWRLSPSASPPPRSQSPPRRYSPSQVNIVIDEKPSESGGTGGRNGDGNGVGEHFEPPGLFTTSLMPSKRAKRTMRKQEKQQQEAQKQGDKEEGETDDEVKTPEESLLLPAHVVIEGQDGEEGDRQVVQDQDGVHIFDDSQAKVSRASESAIDQVQLTLPRVSLGISTRRPDQTKRLLSSRRRTRAGYA